MGAPGTAWMALFVLGCGCAVPDEGRPLVPFKPEPSAASTGATPPSGDTPAESSSTSTSSGGLGDNDPPAPPATGEPPHDEGDTGDPLHTTTSTGDALGPELCDNGIDDNADGDVDCEDPACADEVCLPSACHGGFCDVDPTCHGTRCAWSGTNCAPCPNGYAVRADCWDGDWFACNVPAGWSAEFEPDQSQFPDQDWQDLGNGCALCNTHGPAKWVISAP